MQQPLCRPARPTSSRALVGAVPLHQTRRLCTLATVALFDATHWLLRHAATVVAGAQVGVCRRLALPPHPHAGNSDACMQAGARRRRTQPALQLVGRPGEAKLAKPACHADERPPLLVQPFLASLRRCHGEFRESKARVWGAPPFAAKPRGTFRTRPLMGLLTGFGGMASSPLLIRMPACLAPQTQPPAHSPCAAPRCAAVSTLFACLLALVMLAFA